MVTLELLRPPVSPEDVSALGTLLGDAVENGASIGFMKPVDRVEIAAYWSRVIADVEHGNRLIWVARDPTTGAVTGSAQLSLETRSNGRHRAEVQKVVVRSRGRRRGTGSALVEHIEAAARARNITLLFLDTSVGPGGACAFYEKLGYSFAGGIPGYALDPDGAPASNAIFYKILGPC